MGDVNKHLLGWLIVTKQVYSGMPIVHGDVILLCITPHSMYVYGAQIELSGAHRDTLVIQWQLD